MIKFNLLMWKYIDTILRLYNEVAIRNLKNLNLKRFGEKTNWQEGLNRKITKYGDTCIPWSKFPLLRFQGSK